jgi:hypothetical protein
LFVEVFVYVRFEQIEELKLNLFPTSAERVITLYQKDDVERLKSKQCKSDFEDRFFRNFCVFFEQEVEQACVPCIDKRHQDKTQPYLFRSDHVDVIFVLVFTRMLLGELGSDSFSPVGDKLGYWSQSDDSW